MDDLPRGKGALYAMQDGIRLAIASNGHGTSALFGLWGEAVADVENMSGSDPARSPEGGMMAYTPGPWQTESALNPEGSELLVMEPTTYRVIASLEGRAGYDHDEATANARLVSAAPELLKALRTVIEALEETAPKGGWKVLANAIPAARAAIAKAEGKS